MPLFERSGLSFYGMKTKWNRKVSFEPIDPVALDTVAQMIKVCQKGTFTGDRNIAILLCLLVIMNYVHHHG